jgi:hypothetical protein
VPLLPAIVASVLLAVVLARPGERGKARAMEAAA